MKRCYLLTTVLALLWCFILGGIITVAMSANNAQGADLAPWAGGSMPPIGSSYGYRGSGGGYYVDNAVQQFDGSWQINRVSPPATYYGSPVFEYDRPRIIYQPQYYQPAPVYYERPRPQPTHSDWQVVPKRGSTVRYGWSLRCGCLGGSYWVWERQVFSW